MLDDLSAIICFLTAFSFQKQFFIVESLYAAETIKTFKLRSIAIFVATATVDIETPDCSLSAFQNVTIDILFSPFLYFLSHFSKHFFI